MGPWLKKHFPRLDRAISSIANWATVGGLLGLGALMTWAASAFSDIAQHGLGAVVFAGVGMTCLIAFAVRALLPIFIYLWPPQPFKKILDDRLAPMHEIIEHVAARIGDTDRFGPKARLAIRQAAIDDRLKIYGHKSEETIFTNKTSYSAVRTLIPRMYWESVDIWVTAANNEEFANDYINHTFSHEAADGVYTKTKMTVYYAKLSANWNEVINLWPHVRSGEGVKGR